MTEQTAASVLLVTGLSGAGMSSALKALEDIGYEVFDNFPLSLLEPLLRQSAPNGRPLAVGIDTRTRGFAPDEVMDMAARLKARLLFITCDEATLQKRFSETRRRHPLAKDKPVSDGIKAEQALLYPLRARADVVIDTGGLSIHDLRRSVEGQFGLGNGHILTLTFLSFGYKHGVPREADIVMDVRFLRNPHWDDVLRPLTGREREVQAYIEEDETFAPFLEHFKALLGPLLPRYVQEGKNYLTVAVGCTGGRHRSVYVAEEMARWAKDRGAQVHAEHRDLTRDR